MKTTDKIKSYGRLNTATIRACAKNKAFAKAMILAYIDQRADLTWVFCICNIVNQTGITEKTVKYYIKELQAEGVLIKVPISQYKGQMRSNMTYYSLDKSAYENNYWTVEEEQPEKEIDNDTAADNAVGAKGGNDYRDKGVTIPDKGGNHSRLKVVISSGKGGSHSDKGANDSEKGGNHSGKGGNGYLEKGVTATPIYRRVEEDEKLDEEEREKDREKGRRDCLPASLPASRFSEVIKNSVNPFSQPMFVEGPNRPAPRNDNAPTKLNQSNKSDMVKGSEAGQLQKADQPAEESKSGKSTVSAPSSFPEDTKAYKNTSGESHLGKSTVSAPSSFRKDTKLTDDAKPYNYTIDGTTHEIFFDEQESNPSLSPVEKVAVLKHALKPLITTGEVDVPRASVMQVTGKSFEMARQLFQVNPSLSVSSLLKPAWECNRVAYENPVKESGFKPCFTHRAATESLTYLLKNLDTINGTMPEELRLPEGTVFLTVE